MKKKIIPILCFFCSTIAFAYGDLPSPSEVASTVTSQEISDHIFYLASDKLEGRRTATEGEKLASQYISKEFKSYGLLPAGEKGSYFQQFPVITGRSLGKANALSLQLSPFSQELEKGKDFDVHAYSSTGKFSGSLIFAGYGVQGKNQDDYGKVSLEGKILIVMEGLPQAVSQRIPRRYRSYYNVAFKASIARQKKATALLVGVPEIKGQNSFSSAPGGTDFGLPVLFVSQKILEKFFQAGGKDLSALLKKYEGPVEFSSALCKGSTQLHPIKSMARNVIGYIPGSDPKLSKEVIVIGAHYDHLGWGGQGSGSLAPDAKAIHHGADDNASGTATMLEIAEALSIYSGVLKRTYVFMAFSGEEMGLLGSAYYVSHPLFPLKNTVAMLNLDMVGRLKEKRLSVMGSGTAKEWERIISGVSSQVALDLDTKDKGGFGPSDQTSFYKHKIPVLFFFTGLHTDYHKPTDTWEKINSSGAAKIGQLVFQIAYKMEEVEKLTYVEVKAPVQIQPSRSGARPYFGVVPEYSSDGKGLPISGVSEGSPAQKAGLKGGDIIIQFGKDKINNIYDLTRLLQNHEPGDKVNVVVKRGKETVTLEVVLGKR